MVCAITLTKTDAYAAPYLFAAAFALYCLWQNRIPQALPRPVHTAVIALSALFSFLITLANHLIWHVPAVPDIHSALFFRAMKLFLLLVIFGGSSVSVYNMLRFLWARRDSYPLKQCNAGSGFKWFLIPAATCLLVYLGVFFLCAYPGMLSLDSIDQISQMFSGQYSNHHPLMHTLLVEAFIKTSLSAGFSMNAAVASFSIFQIILLSASMGFLIKTMHDMGFSRGVLAVSSVWCLMPFHMMFSFTLWKDVIFGISVLLFVLFALRMINGIGKPSVNYAGAAASGIGFCLFRSNGLFAFALTAIALFFLVKKCRRLVILMASAIALSLVLKHGVFSLWNVTPPDTVEVLSIPLQQVARVIADDRYIEEADRKLISNIIDIDEAKRSYDPGLSDPIKNLIREHGNQQFITDNKGAFIGMYLRTLVHNPTEYLIAFADQTKGFWNAGYPCMVWYSGIETNSFGIRHYPLSEWCELALSEYLWLFAANPVFQVFVSIGLFVWAAALLFFKSLAGRSENGTITILPVAAIVLSLLISTPAFSEFRYVYSLYCLMPLIVCAPLMGRETDGGQKMTEVK